MKKLTFLFSIVFTLVLASCSAPSPKEYFTKTALNSNLVTAYYTPKFFDDVLEQKAKNRLTVFKEKSSIPATVEEYFKDRIPDLSQNISEIKSLKKTDDTKELLEASTAYFEQADKIFKNDYPKIAKMIDENKPQLEIQTAINKIFADNDSKMFEYENRLHKAAATYAKKHNLPVVQESTNK